MLVKIRPMIQDDIDRVYAIELSAHRAPWSREILRDCVHVGYDCRIAVDDDSKELLAYIICRHNFNVCHILNLCVAVTHQNKGYGKLLLSTVLDSLPTTINTIILEVRPSNKFAIALYEGFGFTQDSVKKAYYKDTEGEEDAILFKKTLHLT